MSASFSSKSMPIIAVRQSKVAYPTGNKNFAVQQPFPAAFSAEEADPFLMCDFFGPNKSTGKAKHPDEFPLAWHPHRGMDILTYIIEGTGRHGDSMGNREEFASPGMQWISVGSGIEHAEGGGTAEGENTTDFQIWVNVPTSRKMDDPRYGTEPPERIPNITVGSGSSGRIMAGETAGHRGPFATVQDVQMVDYGITADDSFTHTVPENLDNCLAFVYKGIGTICGAAVKPFTCIRFDATTANRGITLQAAAGAGGGMSVMVFAGKRLNQPIAWHGPFVMTTDDELRQVIGECRRGEFPPKRVQWDYKRIATKPGYKDTAEL